MGAPPIAAPHPAPPAAILSRPQQVSFGFEKITPPSPLYIQRDDLLQVRIDAPIVSTGPLLVQGRMLMPPDQREPLGEIQPISFPIPTPPTGTTYRSFNLQEGYLLSLVIFSTGSLVQRGGVFAQVQLIKGGTGQTAVVETLISDFLVGSTPIAWPNAALRNSVEGPGRLRSITGTLPAAGADISETVPAGVRWRFISLQATLTTSATVVNRQPAAVLDDGVNAYFTGPQLQASTASQTTVWTFSVAGILNGTAGQTVNSIVPPGVLLPAGHRIRTRTANLQVGDTWTAPQYLVEEWPEGT